MPLGMRALEIAVGWEGVIRGVFRPDGPFAPQDRAMRPGRKVAPQRILGLQESPWRL